MQSISEWLLSLGLAQYASVFEDNGIDLEVLAMVSEGNLDFRGTLWGFKRSAGGGLSVSVFNSVWRTMQTRSN
jgi:hypothetical protein